MVVEQYRRGKQCGLGVGHGGTQCHFFHVRRSFVVCYYLNTPTVQTFLTVDTRLPVISPVNADWASTWYILVSCANCHNFNSAHIDTRFLKL